MTDTKELRRLALLATPGPWTYFPKPKYNEHHVSVPIEGSGMRRGLFDDGCPTDRPEQDAKFIAAASPSVVLALLDEVESRQWVSVEDRMPPPYEEVMVWPYPSDYCMTAQWWAAKKKWQYGDYITGHGHEWTEAHGITHWMPMPKAPVASHQPEKEEGIADQG